MSTKTWLVNQDLSGNELRNAVVHPLGTDPGSPRLGQLWFNTADNTLRVRAGASITQLLASVAWVQAQDFMVRSTYDSTGNGKVDVAELAEAVAWANVTGKPTTFAPSAHAHPIADVTGLQTALDGKLGSTATAAAATKLATARTFTFSGDLTGSFTFDGSANVSASAQVADNSHNHTIANITSLQTTLDGKAATAHTHGSGDITDFATAVNAQIVAYIDGQAGADADLDTLREILDQIKLNRDNLQALPKRFAQTMGDGVATSFVLVHNFNTKDVVCQVYDATTGSEVLVDTVRNTVNQLTVTFAVAPAANAYRAVLVA